MNDKNNFALVPKLPGSLEKAEPGAKRIVSSMIADMLALTKEESPQKARPLRIIMVDDDVCVLGGIELMMQYLRPEDTTLTFHWAGDALKEVERQHPDLITTDWNHAGMPGAEILERLAAMKLRCPIFVLSASADIVQKGNLLRDYVAAGLNVTLLAKPFLLEDLRLLLSLHLGVDYPELGNSGG
jgi:CheY-like chemotaxis protein